MTIKKLVKKPNQTKILTRSQMFTTCSRFLCSCASTMRSPLLHRFPSFMDDKINHKHVFSHDRSAKFCRLMGRINGLITWSDDISCTSLNEKYDKYYRFIFFARFTHCYGQCPDVLIILLYSKMSSKIFIWRND